MPGIQLQTSQRRRNVEKGQTVAAGLDTPPLFLVAADLTLTYFDAILSEKDIGELKLGDKASILVSSFPNHPFTGEVTQIRPSQQKIQTYDVVISAPNADLLLKPGMTATIRILVDRRDDVLRAPNQALRYSPRELAVTNGAGNPGRCRMARRGSGSYAMESHQRSPSNSASTTAPTRKLSQVMCSPAMS